MPEEPKLRRKTTSSVWMSGREFLGFAAPTSNTTYTPNQFFDVCLPHSSRGTVRLVGYLLRKTLGWCDADGNPQHEEILISYQDLIENAGISRGAIQEAIREAAEAKFIYSLRAGQSKAAGQGSVTAMVSLRWDERSSYVKDPKQFAGFFAGEGNRTYIPNQFFDHLIPNEALSVVKVVGSIIRFSIGFQNQYGFRRQKAALSYDHIQNYSRLKNRTSLAQAIQEAKEKNYIHCVEQGIFDRNAGKTSRPASYSIKWLDSRASQPIGSKNVPEDSLHEDEDRFKKRTGIGSKTLPEDRFKKRTDIKIKQGNKTFKQQQQVSAIDGEMALCPAAAELIPIHEKLKAIGFDNDAAVRLASVQPLEVIENQINWLEERRPNQNRLGMLRRAIEENWPKPTAQVRTSELFGAGPEVTFARHFYAGYGNNAGEPTAEPSRNDLSASAAYVKRLVEAWPEPEQVEKWGRAFGRLCRERQGGNNKAFASLVLALRSYGDEFFARHLASRDHRAAQVRITDRATHEAQFKPAWFEYLRAAEQQLKQDRAEDYAQFENHRGEERQHIQTSPWKFSAVSTEQMLASFDSDERRLTDFQQFFPQAVLGFWKWAEKHNAQPA